MILMTPVTCFHELYISQIDQREKFSPLLHPNYLRYVHAEMVK